MTAVSGYTCDWPDSGGVCGREATWFRDNGAYHRPLCVLHYNEPGGARLWPIDDIDPTKVPRKVPAQAERARLDADRTAQPKTVIEGVHKIDKRGGVTVEPDRWVVREGVTKHAATVTQTTTEAPKVEWPTRGSGADGAPNGGPPRSTDAFTEVDRTPPTPTPSPTPPSVAPPLSRPPLKEALADVAIAFLGALKKEIEGYKR